MRGPLQTRHDRYQRGSLRKVKRSNGFAWEFRYYVLEDGRRQARSQYYDGRTFPTEKSVRQKLEAQLLKLNRQMDHAQAAPVTFNALLDRYIDEELPSRHSTRGSYSSIINRQLRPQWGEREIASIRPAELHAWFQGLALAPITKSHLRSLLHKMFDLASLWEYLPLERRNPVELVKIKSATARQKRRWFFRPSSFVRW